jgi:protein kinase-like protein
VLPARLRRLFARTRLLTRVALALAAVGLLPVVIASYRLVDLNQEGMYEQVQRTHVVAAEATAARVSAFLSTRLSLVGAAAASPALADPRGAAARALLGEDLAAWADLGALALAVVNGRGEEVVRAQLRDAAAPARVARALAPRGGGAVLALPGGPLLRLAAPLPDGAGALRLVCDGSALAAAVQPAELGEQAELVVVDADGRAVLGSAATLAAFPAALVRTALSAKVTGAGRFRGTGGGRFLGAYTAVPGAGGWAVLSRQPTRFAEALAGGVRRRAALAIATALALVALLSAAAYVSLVQPIQALVAAQRRLAKKGEDAAGGDEIAQLQSAFAALEQSLADRAALGDVLLGRYQVLEHLGTGAMGSVFRGFDPRLQRPVALKTVRLGADLAPAARRDLVAVLAHEAVTVARLNHPDVVAVYDFAAAPDGAFVAMEFVDGMSLEALLARRHRLRVEEVLPLGAAIARGLAAAHQRGIVHRDVKPANVLLGRDGAVKVGDFGIADVVAAAAHDSESLFGTPGYVPPECLQGAGYTPASDLFSLGVVLYFCLTGTRPFVGKNASEIVKATIFGALRPLGRQVPGLPPRLESLVLHLLERDPARRPSDAAAVAAELDAMAAERRLRWSFDPGEDWKVRRIFTPESQWIPTSRIGATPRMRL